METYAGRKEPLQSKRYNASAMRSVTAVTHSGVLLLMSLLSQGRAPPYSILNAAVVEKITQPTTGAVIWLDAKARFLSGCQLKAAT